MDPKTQLIAGTAHKIGGRLEDLLEVAKREVSRWDGQKEGALKCAKQVEGLFVVLQKSTDDGQVSLEEATRIKGWLLRAVASCEGISGQAGNLGLMAQGQVQGLERGMQLAKQEYELAVEKGRRRQEEIAEEPKEETKEETKEEPTDADNA